MKRCLNTLFVSTQGAYLHKEGESVLVKVEQETKLRVPLHNLDGIVCFGNVLMSPFLMGHCAECDVTVSFLTEYGRFLARVQGPVSGNVLLRREQYRRAESLEHSAQLARSIVMGKIANCRTVLRRAMRDHAADDADIIGAINRFDQYLNRLKQPQDLDVIRGIEGDAAHSYFSVFQKLITVNHDEFTFEKRTRRPPLDRVNAMLSFAYSILMHDVRSALEGVGLDSAVGYLHRDRPGRPGLALDLMEEFRPVLADRIVLSLINRRQVKADDFRQTETGAVLMDDAARKEFLVTWQKRKQEEIVHPFLLETVPIGLIFHLQARLLARHLRGDLDGYPPFIWK